MAIAPVSPIELGSTVEQLLPLDNPYQFDSERVQAQLQTIVSERIPYIDVRTNPDIGDQAIYLIDGQEPAADAARAEEGVVLEAEWGLPAEVTQEDFAPFENNSQFFLMVDKSDPDNLRASAVLRIADCMEGPSETIGFFQENYGDRPIPPEMQPDADSQTLWDIVVIAADPDYRGGDHTAWLYHALYRYSLEQGVTKWISNVTPDEMRNLRTFIRIPFEEVPGVDTVYYESPDGKKTPFDFFSIEVDQIFDSVSENITSLEVRPGMSRKIARLARIALLGDATQPSADAAVHDPAA